MKHKSSLRRDDLYEQFDKNKYGSLGIKDVKSEGAFSSPFSKEEKRVTWSDSSGDSTPQSLKKESCKVIELSPCRLMRRIKSDSDLSKMDRRVSTIGEQLPSNFSELMKKPTPYPIKPIQSNCLHIINTCFECKCLTKIDILTYEIQYACPCCAKVYKKMLKSFIVN